MTATIIIAAIFTILLITLIFLGHTVYRMVFRGLENERPAYDILKHPSAEPYCEQIKANIDRMTEEDHQTVSIRSYDGLTLYAEYYHRNDDAPLQIMCHGYRSSPLRDLAGGGCEALNKGYNLLFIHHRSHGKSQGKSITFGAKERLDLKAWIDYVNSFETRPRDIILMGLSMGAATVLLTSALPLSDNVRCIIADCPYSSAKEIIMHQIKERHMPDRIVYPLVRAVAILSAGFDPDKTSVTEAVKVSKIPILLIHGEDDRFVPTEMSSRICSAAKSCTLLTVPGAKHGSSYIVNRDKYMEAIDSFTEKYLSSAEGNTNENL